MARFELCPHCNQKAVTTWSDDGSRHCDAQDCFRASLNRHRRDIWQYDPFAHMTDPDTARAEREHSAAVTRAIGKGWA